MPWIEPEFVAIEPGTDTVRSRLDLDTLNNLELSFHHLGKRRFPAVCQIEEARQTLPGLLNTFPETKNRYPKITSLRKVRFFSPISAATVKATCVFFLLDDTRNAAFTIRVGERLTAEGTMEFALVGTTSPQPPPGFRLISRESDVDKEIYKVTAEYDYTGEEILDLSELTHLPETLVLEAMVRGAIQIREGKSEYTKEIFWFTGIESAEFLEPIPKEGKLDLLANIEAEEKRGLARCWALYAGKTVAQATITFAITRGKAIS